ncbi:hypothetical protein KC723_01295 [Candidatus Kaiserbacteria bacterium]|nr:hypothetical protein [Candidatus Kaiserbacteria bacterium]
MRWLFFHIKNTLIQSVIGTLLIASLISVSYAQVRSSGNYQIQSDSINFGGGLSNSASYELESTGGEIATGPSDSNSYSLRAGYQQMQEVYLSMTAPSNVFMTPDIGGLVGGESNGSTSVNVMTDSPSGYSLTIVAENNPAMQKGVDTIADYSPVAADPDTWFATGATEAHFGFSPYGPDTVTRFLEDSGSCNQVAGSASTTACWDGLSTSEAMIATDTNANHPTGATTTVYFKVGVGGSVGLTAGYYYATTTLTALPL